MYFTLLLIIMGAVSQHSCKDQSRIYPTSTERAMPVFKREVQIPIPRPKPTPPQKVTKK